MLSLIALTYLIDIPIHPVFTHKGLYVSSNHESEEHEEDQYPGEYEGQIHLAAGDMCIRLVRTHSSVLSVLLILLNVVFPPLLL